MANLFVLFCWFLTKNVLIEGTYWAIMKCTPFILEMLRHEIQLKIVKSPFVNTGLVKWVDKYNAL